MRDLEGKTAFVTGAASGSREDELYVFTHPEMRDEVDARFAAITAALDKAEAR
jgi:hypothetical protein